MKYISRYGELSLTIELDKHPNWWVDSSYTVHPEMHSHSGISITLGKGMAYSTSCKQKLNAKSSTEAELLAIDDSISQVLCTRHFLSAQVLYIQTMTFYQDNKSTILLAENRKGSSSRYTWHLDIRYFFVTDKIKKGEVKVAFCPMHDMLGDFFTKPLQGTLFMHMQEKILNLHSSTGTTVHRSVLRKAKNKTKKSKWWVQMMSWKKAKQKLAG